MELETLLRPRLPEGDVEIPGVGTVRVRGLSRYHIATAQLGDDTLAIERRMLHFGMVDPPMSEDDVAAWQKASPVGEINPVAAKINELSGIGEGADKALYKSDGSGSEPGV
jgi:hypothetical protein